jgi:eukaryotic-like serine/threonine-protein kinase
MAAVADDFPRLEKYELLEEIGHGGMATVYRARDLRLGREVAVKIIHRHLRDNPEVASRFVAEARAAASLKHRGIVEVYDVSDEGDRERFLVVELVRGRTLRQLLVEQRDMPAEVGASIVLELCDALQHAHESGIVHRDVKPENVLIALRKSADCDPGGVRRSTRGRDSVRESGASAASGSEVVAASSSEHAEAEPRARALSPSDGALILKLTDFGIAKLLDAQGVTSTGQVLGSPAHMAPEQIEGREIDARTDVFALGVVLYECLAGHLPFEGKNPAQVLRRVLEGDFAPADSVRPVVGGRYARFAAEALDTEPSRRPESAQALAARLRAELSALGIENPRAEVVAYLDDPEAYTESLPARLVPRLLDRGEAARRSGDVECAAADFNRAHALAPDDMAVLKRITQLGQRRDRKVLLRRASIGVVMLGVLGLVGGLGWWATRSSPTRLARSEISTEGTPLLPEREATSAPVSLPKQPLVAKPRSTSVASALRAPPLRRIAASAQAKPTEPRSVRFVVQPRGAHLEVDGARIDHFGGTLTLSPGVHEAKLSPPPGDPCCDAVSTSFRVLPAPENEPGQVQSVPLSLRFRPATVRIANGPVGGMVTCGAFLSMGVGATREVTMTTAVWEGYCTFIGEGRSEQAFRTIRAGVSNALAWPNPS